MQGGKSGNRPYTAVLTKAERDKFDRTALSFLTTRSDPSANRPLIQAIDFDAFAKSWNEDVTEEERNEQAGRLETDGANLVNRKTASDLQHYMSESKRGVNMKRTMEPHRHAMAQLRKNQRVDVLQSGLVAQGSGGGLSVGVFQSGARIVFPSSADASSVLPRPLPVWTPMPRAEGEEGGGGSSGDEEVIEVGTGDGDGGGGAAVIDMAERIGVTVDGDGVASSSRESALEPSQSSNSSAVGGASPGGGSILGQAPEGSRGVRGGGDPRGVPGGVRDGGGGAGAVRAGGLVAVGDPCFVMPVQACSTLRAIVPKFGLADSSSRLLQPWNPRTLERPAEAQKPAPQPRAKPMCQTCGHGYTSGHFASHVFHRRQADGRLECLVASNERRQPTFPNRARGKFTSCTCPQCVG